MIYRRMGLVLAAYLAAMAAGHAVAGWTGFVLVAGFVIGSVAADFAWAYRLGIVQALWHQWRHRNDPVEVDDLDG